MQLSGGQQQRVAIARALASEVPVILADELTGSLDEDTAQGIASLLRESAHQMGKCVVVVTHSRELARDADVVFRLKRGTLVTACGKIYKKALDKRNGECYSNDNQST